MSDDPHDSRWEPVKRMMSGSAPVRFGPMHAYHVRHTPRRLLYALAYYKFAAKMIVTNLPCVEGNARGRVLDVGCGEGLGTWLLATECGSAHGIDFDAGLVDTAVANWTGETDKPDAPRATFACTDFVQGPSAPARTYDGAVSLDVIEHILPSNAEGFVARIADALDDDGVAVVGTPNVHAGVHASAVTNAGHVNMYDAERLQKAFTEHFRHVMVFAANDEVVHTGFFPMAHYLLAVACRPRR